MSLTLTTKSKFLVGHQNFPILFQKFWRLNIEHLSNMNFKREFWLYVTFLVRFSRFRLSLRVLSVHHYILQTFNHERFNLSRLPCLNKQEIFISIMLKYEKWQKENPPRRALHYNLDSNLSWEYVLFVGFRQLDCQSRLPDWRECWINLSHPAAVPFEEELRNFISLMWRVWYSTNDVIF